MDDLKNSTLSGMVWKFIENFGTQFINFVIQVVLARILMPEDYGIIALTSVLIIIANVFIQTGFTSALIQRKEINELECSSVFYAGLAVAIVLYAALFFSSSAISSFYKEPILVWVLRAQASSLIFGGLTSVHNALLTRNLQFKKSFKKSLIAIILQGITGITLASLGFGVWALVCANLVNYITSSVVLWIIVDWRPKWQFSFTTIKNLFPFSSKILVIALFNAIFQNIKSLIIGKKFDSSTLGYYNRGFQIPTLIMTNVDGAMNAVMFPVLSKCQDDRERLTSIMRRSLKTSCFIIFPLMIGLFAVAEPLTEILLTEKWLPSVPFMQITCLICLFWPFSIRYQAFNALGRSDISLKLDIISKAIAVALIVVSLPFSVYVLVLSELASTVISNVFGIIVIKKVLGYQYSEQLKDILPSLVLSILMGAAVWSVQYILTNVFVVLLIQVFLGILIYIAGAALLKFETFQYLLTILKDLLHNFKRTRKKTMS